MSDYLAKGTFARKVVDTLGLPLPTPETLNRSQAAYAEKPLEGRTAIAQISDDMAAKLKEAGLSISLGDDKVNGLILDGTAYRTVDDLVGAYSFFNTNLRKLKRNGRIVVIAGNAETVEGKAIQRALDGIVRSIAKEIGRKGSTANMLVWTGKDDAIKAQQLLLSAIYLLSDHSAYVDAQPLTVGDAISVPTDGFKKSLEGKVALVTGAARGIGAAIAYTLAREGAKVMVVDMPQEEKHGSKVAADCNGSFMALDVTASDAPEKLRSWLEQEAGAVDMLIHNAGITRDKTLSKMDKKYWDMVLAVNFQAILNINKELVPNTLKEGGTIIGMSSISGLSGNFGQSNYAATKAALIGYAEAYAPELSARNISINAIAPGFIETKMTETMPFFTKEGGRRLNNLAQAGYPEDIAEMTAFLCMPGAKGITGQTLRVCGGSMIGA